MKILIIGGTGATGRELVKQGLEVGHQITVLARNPAKVNLKHPDLRVLKGDVLDPVSIQQAVAGQDAVLSALGHKKFFFYSTILSRGTKNMVDAMKKEGVKRFICITSLGIGDSRFRMGLYYTLFVIPVILPFYFLDKEKQERIIRNNPLDWTIVRPCQLTNGKLNRTYKQGKDLGNYFITKLISRANVAHFMLRILQEKTYIHQTPGITNF